MKLRYWYKIDHSKKPIPGSNVRRKSRPGANHQWKEILDPCCSPLDITCTCGPRYFVQLDGKNKPVDGTLIKRIKGDRPEGTDGAKFYELDWKSVCCGGITYDFGFDVGAEGTFTITVNGVTKVNSAVAKSGKVPANLGDVIVVTLTNGGNLNMDNTFSISGGETYSSTSEPATHTFIWNGEDTDIQAYVTLQPNVINWNFNEGGGYSASIHITAGAEDITGGPLIDPLGDSFGANIGDLITLVVDKITGASGSITIILSGSMVDSDTGTDPFTHSFTYTGGSLTIDINVPT